MATIKLITSNNGKVSAYEDAVLQHFIKGGVNYTGTGYSGGVLSSTGAELGFSVDQAAKTFTVKTGMGIIWGRLFSVEANVVFDLSSFTRKKYVNIYLEVNTNDSSNETAQIKMSHGDIAYPSLSVGSNLVENKNGIARMSLYQFRYSNTPGTPIDMRSIESDIPRLQADKVQYSYQTDNLPSKGRINGRNVYNIVDQYSDTVKDSQKINGNTIDANWRANSKPASMVSVTRMSFVNRTYANGARTRIAKMPADTGTLPSGDPYTGFDYYSNFLFANVMVTELGSNFKAYLKTQVAQINFTNGLQVLPNIVLGTTTFSIELNYLGDIYIQVKGSNKTLGVAIDFFAIPPAA